MNRWWRLYRTSLGRHVVKEEIQDLGRDAKGAVTEAMKRHTRGHLFPYEEEHIRGDIHAIRIFHDGSTYRLVYAYEGNSDQVLLGLHCIQKKGRKLPQQALRTAERRLRDWRSRGSGR